MIVGSAQFLMGNLQLPSARIYIFYVQVGRDRNGQYSRIHSLLDEECGGAVDWPLGLTSLPLEEVLEEMLDKPESATVEDKQGGIGMVKTVGSTRYLMRNVQVQLIGRLD